MTMLNDQIYAETIGEKFVEVRGAGFALSSFDVELISKWHGKGVPLHIPVNVLADVADRLRGRMPGDRSQVRIRSLAYVQEEVEARFAELLDGHVGCGGCEKSYCSGGADDGN